ncbi:MAG: Rne/Rng family ribonuclease, partial [Planctomycetota bacterium]
MSRKMLMNVVDPEEIRVAITDAGGELEELYLERTGACFQAGNIYKGKVQNIEPSLQAAFIDIGGEKNAFLHVRDIIPPDGGYKGVLKKRRGRKPAETEGNLSIENMLWKGQELLVQITRESIAHKGPSVTTYVSLPGRYLVLMPAVAKRGVSKKIRDPEERNLLRKALDELDPPKDQGFIIRTAGMGKGKKELKNDLSYLERLWGSIKKRTKKAKAPALIYEETDLVIRGVRDFMSDDINEVLIDNENEYKRTRDFLAITMPKLKRRARLYKGKDPLFVHYGVDRQIDRVFARKVELSSGGHIVIDQTEAMVAIDVNSGSFKNAENSRDMILKTNMDAAAMIARQLRLRDLGGLIMVDFIDMDAEKDRVKVEEFFKQELSRDRAKMTVLHISPLGVLEMTRQRIRKSLRASVFEQCPSCRGLGMTKSVESLGLDFIRMLRGNLYERQGVLAVKMH